jgi:hypothetical protein
VTVTRTPVRFGLGIGGLGVLAHLVTVFLVFTLPHHFLGDETGRTSVQNWFDPITTVGGGLAFYVTPVLAGFVAAYLVWTAELSVESVLVGFAVGSLGFGLAVTLTNWAVTGPGLRQSVLEYANQTGRHAVHVFGPAVVGALAGRFLDRRRGLRRE